MDNTLSQLFLELCLDIEKCQAKNPSLNMESILRTSLLIQGYIYKNEPPLSIELTPHISYEDLSKCIRVPRRTPPGYIGPSHAMIQYADEEDNKRARLVDRVILYGKNFSKN